VPRDPIAALVQLALGLVVGTAGMLMAGWAVTTYLNVELGFDAMVWVAEHSPVALDIAPAELANAAIRHSSLVAIGVAGFFLWAIGSGFMRAARANLRPSEGPDAGEQAAAVAPPSSAAHSTSTVFARHMLSDTPSHAPSHAPSHDTRSFHATHDERVDRPVAPSPRVEAELAGLARLLNDDGRFTAQQRAVLAKLTPEQHALLAKLSQWAPSRKNAIIALVALFVAFQVLPSIFSLLLNR